MNLDLDNRGRKQKKRKERHLDLFLEREGKQKKRPGEEKDILASFFQKLLLLSRFPEQTPSLSLVHYVNEVNLSSIEWLYRMTF